MSLKYKPSVFEVGLREKVQLSWTAAAVKVPPKCLHNSSSSCNWSSQVRTQHHNDRHFGRPFSRDLLQAISGHDIPHAHCTFYRCYWRLEMSITVNNKSTARVIETCVDAIFDWLLLPAKLSSQFWILWSIIMKILTSLHFSRPIMKEFLLH